MSEHSAEKGALRAELAEVLREIGPKPGGVMHPDRLAERLLDHEWFKRTVARKQAEANRVTPPTPDGAP